tara:strand:+ start:59 stop:502 length:444 start_codon:yes stop_codon:yes gene_type:complete
MKISRKKLAQIIKEEIMSALNEQSVEDRMRSEEDPTGVFAPGDPKDDGRYQDSERKDLDPIKTSHKNMGIKGPTRLKAAGKELIAASNKFSEELEQVALQMKNLDLDAGTRETASKIGSLFFAHEKLHLHVVRRVAGVLKLVRNTRF